jgi:hypothetical protein
MVGQWVLPPFQGLGEGGLVFQGRRWRSAPGYHNDAPLGLTQRLTWRVWRSAPGYHNDAPLGLTQRLTWRI